MATRAVKAQPADWRAAFRRALRRALQMTGGALLYALTGFLALALVSYEQTDPSFSTAAAGPAQNWMGTPGAWAADLAFLGFGWLSVLLLPLTWVAARKLWRDAEEEDTPHGRKWWIPLILLLVGIALLGTVLELVTDPHNVEKPAGWGGLAGLLGAGSIEALAGRLPEAAQVWTILGAGIACLAGGAALVGKVFAFDWAQLLTLPDVLRRMPSLPREENPFKPTKRAPRPPDRARR